MESGTIPLQNTITVSKSGIDIPDPSEGVWATYTVDLTNVAPDNAILISVSIGQGNYNYFLPYGTSNGGGSIYTYASYNTVSKILTIRNNTTGWTNCTLYLTFKLS